uniref:LOW QUALITY PROTEIN: putative F-box/kelch-repeat protein At1g13200 n=1 Tax=Nicotiana sylvestris TaxID=4096 RepID=A0A1U7YFT6_NICSY|nr:PREDICTED: LOW QUALITY PROTEIN: putative F-box/kelch-repeat protein At1g13200 [Nicotiana sylvestris]
MVHGILKKLPEDVFIHILLKLPVKSLIRFKCISKTWYILMESSTFINLHLNHAINAKDEFIVFKLSFQEDPFQHKTILSFLFGDDDDDYLTPVSPDLDVPYLTSTFSSNYDQLIGPCQGLIALINIVDTVLFNPATRNYRLVPPCPFPVPKGFRVTLMVLGLALTHLRMSTKLL